MVRSRDSLRRSSSTAGARSQVGGAPCSMATATRFSAAADPEPCADAEFWRRSVRRANLATGEGVFDNVPDQLTEAVRALPDELRSPEMRHLVAGGFVASHYLGIGF